MIEGLDHFVLTVQDVNRTCEFYEKVLKMRSITFGSGRIALEFASMKINLHQYGNEFEPKACKPTPGSADLCFFTSVPLETFCEHLRTCEVAIEEGPVARTGARGPIRSVYFRDPDGNLIEVSNYQG